MGVHTLVTGLNGAGKSLYVVAEKLRPLSTATIEYKGLPIPRRLVVGGVRDLLLEHEMIDVPELDPETYRDEWAGVLREPGQAAVRWVKREDVGRGRYIACTEDELGSEPVVWSAINWWLWVEPGDVIFIDEAQRVFRPMPSGRRVPMYLSKLETARHYGCEFIYATQHPQLLHTNLRALVGPHEDVRRIFGSSRVMVYLWERASNPDRIAKATSKFWKHDKSAYALYKSSELHTKFGQRLPLAVFGLVAGLVALAVLAWVIKGRMGEHFNPGGPDVAASAPVARQAASQAAPETKGGVMQLLTRSRAPSLTFPAYDGEPVRDREPLAGRALQLEGVYKVGAKTFASFGVVLDGERIASLSLAQLVRMGYVFTELGPCAALVTYRELQRAVTCPKPGKSGPPAMAAPLPSLPASVPSLTAAFS